MVEFEIFDGTIFDVAGVGYSEGRVTEKVVATHEVSRPVGMLTQQLIQCINPFDQSAPAITYNLQEGGLKPIKEFNQAGYSLFVKAQDMNSEGLYKRIHIKDGAGQFVSFEISNGMIFDVAGVAYSEGRVVERYVSSLTVSASKPQLQFTEMQYMDKWSQNSPQAQVSVSPRAQTMIVKNAVSSKVDPDKTLVIPNKKKIS